VSQSPKRIVECRKKIIKQVDAITVHLTEAELYELLIQVQIALAQNLSRLERKGV